MPEPKKTLDQLLQPVLTHLAEGLNDRLWRAREARRTAGVRRLRVRVWVRVRFRGRVGGRVRVGCGEG